VKVILVMLVQGILLKAGLEVKYRKDVQNFAMLSGSCQCGG